MAKLIKYDYFEGRRGHVSINFDIISEAARPMQCREVICIANVGVAALVDEILAKVHQHRDVFSTPVEKNRHRRKMEPLYWFPASVFIVYVCMRTAVIPPEFSTAVEKIA